MKFPATLFTQQLVLFITVLFVLSCQKQEELDKKGLEIIVNRTESTDINQRFTFRLKDSAYSYVRWNFGDSTSVEAFSTSKRYFKQGRFLVTATAFDRNGNSIKDSVTVVIGIPHVVKIVLEQLPAMAYRTTDSAYLDCPFTSYTSDLLFLDSNGVVYRRMMMYQYFENQDTSWIKQVVFADTFELGSRNKLQLATTNSIFGYPDQWSGLYPENCGYWTWNSVPFALNQLSQGPLILATNHPLYPFEHERLKVKLHYAILPEKEA